MAHRLLRLDRSSGTPSSLGPLEARVIDVMWSLGGWLSVSDVMAHMKYGKGQKPLAYSTVKTIMQNLADKHHLKKKSAGRANVFTPAVSREEFQRAVIDDVVRPLLKTQRNPLLAHIAGELARDDESYAEFERLLAQKRAERSHE
jgi:predicted transcriptional regulator